MPPLKSAPATSCAASTIRKHRRVNAGEHLMRIGQLVQEGWKEIAKRHDLPIHIGGIPPMSHFSFETENPLTLKALFVQWMLQKGFLATTGFYAMFAHAEGHVQNYLEAVDSVFGCIRRAVTEGKPEQYLLGERAAAGFKRLN